MKDSMDHDLTIYLSEQDVSGFITMKMALDSVRLAFELISKGSASNSLPMQMNFTQGWFSSSTCSIPGLELMGLTSNSNRSNTFVHVSSSVSGNLLAIIEGHQLEEYVIGASIGTATNAMANPQSSSIGIIGCDTGALRQAEAISTIRNIEAITTYDNDLKASKIFAAKLGRCLKVSTSSVNDIEECVRMSDIVIITNYLQPVVQGEWLRPGTHVNTVANKHSLNRTIDSKTVSRASIIAVQDIEQAKCGSGNLIYPIEEGITNWQKVSRISDIVLERRKGRSSLSDITIFESISLAVQETILGLRLYNMAVKNGVGIPVVFSPN